jgi:nucleoid-associated protein YgaU
VSLSAHLTASTVQHGRLRFHPDCPRCQTERLSGSLGADTLVSRRTQAALAAGVLAFSTAAAPPAIAQVGEVEQEQEGSVEPGADEHGLEPEFDPGGDDTFEVDTGPLEGDPGAGGQEDEGQGAPVDAEPPTDSEAPLVLEGMPDSPPPAPEPTPVPTPAPSSPPVEPSAPPPEVVVPPPPSVLKEPEAAEAVRPEIGHLRLYLGPARTAERGWRSAPAPPTGAGQVQPAPTTMAAPPVTQAVSAPPVPVKGDSYTVRPGDSLWSIARRVLEPQASAGRIAREVNRLWELNQARIGTGNPSLIHVGTVLEL